MKAIEHFKLNGTGQWNWYPNSVAILPMSISGHSSTFGLKHKRRWQQSFASMISNFPWRCDSYDCLVLLPICFFDYSGSLFPISQSQMDHRDPFWVQSPPVISHSVASIEQWDSQSLCHQHTRNLSMLGPIQCTIVCRQTESQTSEGDASCMSETMSIWKRREWRILGFWYLQRSKENIMLCLQDMFLCSCSWFRIAQVYT